MGSDLYSLRRIILEVGPADEDTPRASIFLRCEGEEAELPWDEEIVGRAEIHVLLSIQRSDEKPS